MLIVETAEKQCKIKFTVTRNPRAREEMSAANSYISVEMGPSSQASDETPVQANTSVAALQRTPDPWKLQ